MGCGSSNSAVQNNTAAQVTSTVNVRPVDQKMRTYTPAELKIMRTEFWESRVDGSPDMYIAIRSVCEAILNNDNVLAEAILEASNITTFDKTLARCFDERGHEYLIPSYCWSSQGPANLAPISVIPNIEAKTELVNIKNADQPLELKVQINPGDRNFVIKANTSNSVAELKALICEESKIKTEKNPSVVPAIETKQRIIFMGKELKNTQYLGDIGVDGVRVIQVFLRKD